MKNTKDILIGALRRENIAETALQKSEAEIERIDSLVSLAIRTVPNSYFERM